LALPETVAVNWNESPARILAELGETPTETEAGVEGEDGLLGDVDDAVPPQPARVRAANNRSALADDCIALRTHLGKRDNGDHSPMPDRARLLDEREEEGQRPGGSGG
jgi:hypothetical protein